MLLIISRTPNTCMNSCWPRRQRRVPVRTRLKAQRLRRVKLKHAALHYPQCSARHRGGEKERKAASLNVPPEPFFKLFFPSKQNKRETEAVLVLKPLKALLWHVGSTRLRPTQQKRENLYEKNIEWKVYYFTVGTRRLMEKRGLQESQLL